MTWLYLLGYLGFVVLVFWLLAYSVSVNLGTWVVFLIAAFIVVFALAVLTAQTVNYCRTRSFKSWNPRYWTTPCHPKFWFCLAD